MTAFKSFMQKKFPRLFDGYHFLWARASAIWYGNPSRRIFAIGVTGTKGKTTTLELVNAILEAAGGEVPGKKTALLSSLRIKIGEASRKNPMGNSMPGRGYIQKFLRAAARAGCGYALIEVTSQGVVQHRHESVDWKAGVLTNVHPEHIEAHGSFENYRAAKLSFLKYAAAKGGKIFLNRDDAQFRFFARELGGQGHKFIGYAVADATPRGRLAGNFNEENIAAAAAVARELGVAAAVIEKAIAEFPGVPGRMEFVTEGEYAAIVDYAHTPDSLEAAYRAAREELEISSPNSPNIAPRLICVLGAAGGGRDKWKRPEFGKIAARYCDAVILTDEDPYDEDPREIIEAIAEGVRAAHQKPQVFRILDRREALARAVELARPGDIVIATGKGSEDWIHVAQGEKIPWNEKATMEELLDKKNRPAPDMAQA